MRRRDLGRLLVGALAAVSVAACQPSRPKPTAEALDVAKRFGQALRELPHVTSAEASVTTHRDTPPDIGAVVEVSPDLSASVLASLGDDVQAVVDAHQLADHVTGAVLRTQLSGADANWSFGVSAGTGPSSAQQVEALRAEIGRGARTASVSDVVTSTWAEVDEDAALHPAPDGVRYAGRWLQPGEGPQLYATVHAGEPRPDVPLRAALEALAPVVTSANLLAIEGEVRWQVAPGGADAGELADAVTEMLRELRGTGPAGAHTVEFQGPWWVTLDVADDVTVRAWRGDDDRVASADAVEAVLERVNT